MFIKNAQLGPNHFWRYLITLTLMLLAYFVAQIPLAVAVVTQGGNLGATSLAEMGLHSNLALALALLSPVAAFFALWGLIRWLHSRNLQTVLTGRARLDWSRILVGGGLWLLIGGCLELVFYCLHPENYSLILDWQSFLPLLAICLLMIPIQTSFEELLFRGYLVQGIGSISPYRWIPLVLTSVLFGAMHLANPEVQAFGMGYMSIYYVGMGLVLGICTLMDDGLEVALGLHAANNLFASIVLTFENSALETSAIFKMETMYPQSMVIGWLVAVAIYLFILSKIYQWGSIKKLFARI